MNLDERRKRAVSWIEAIAGEVSDLLTDRQIFWEVQKIIENNPKLAKLSSHYFLFIASGYIASAASAVRRQVDASDDAISLLRVVQELTNYPDLITRQYHLAFYGPDPHDQSLGNGTFNKFAACSGDKLDPNQLAGDASVLKSKAEIVKHYVDRRIAHYDKRGVTMPMPTLGDLDAAIDTVKELAEKYYLILKAVSTDLQPTIQYDWQAPFRVQWIP